MVIKWSVLCGAEWRWCMNKRRGRHWNYKVIQMMRNWLNRPLSPQDLYLSCHSPHDCMTTAPRVSFAACEGEACLRTTCSLKALRQTTRRTVWVFQVIQSITAWTLRVCLLESLVSSRMVWIAPVGFVSKAVAKPCLKHHDHDSYATTASSHSSSVRESEPPSARNQVATGCLHHHCIGFSFTAATQKRHNSL